MHRHPNSHIVSTLISPSWKIKMGPFTSLTYNLITTQTRSSSLKITHRISFLAALSAAVKFLCSISLSIALACLRTAEILSPVTLTKCFSPKLFKSSTSSASNVDLTIRYMFYLKLTLRIQYFIKIKMSDKYSIFKIKTI